MAKHRKFGWRSMLYGSAVGWRTVRDAALAATDARCLARMEDPARPPPEQHEKSATGTYTVEAVFISDVLSYETDVFEGMLDLVG